MNRKTVVWVFVLGLLALNWAALRDILGGEPSVWMKWVFAAASLLLGAAYLARKIHEARSQAER
ncbi:MAG: hypothetical protein GXP40_13465 [Chloroflexi bacterium]|nr:hypothetical protein [Chloroflexota bacterium]